MRRSIVVVLATVLLAGCSGEEGFAYADVVETLVDTGISVEEAEFTGGPPFSTRAHRVVVGGHEVRVHEYADIAGQEEEAATIGMEGWSINSTPVEWIGWPHYRVRGRVIVLYLGDDASAIEMVTSALGPPLDLGDSEG